MRKIAIGLAVFLAIGAGYSLIMRQSPAETQGSAAACTQLDRAKLNALAQGDLAALKVLDVPRPLPNFEFIKNGDAPVKLSDFRGKVVLMNFWATWCVPCRAEMPGLAKLQQSLAGQKAEVVAVSMDLGSADKPRKFLQEIQADALTLYHDPKAQSLQTLKTIGRGAGLPATLLIDANGCEQAFLLGPAEWGGAGRLIQTLNEPL